MVELVMALLVALAPLWYVRGGYIHWRLYQGVTDSLGTSLGNMGRDGFYGSKSTLRKTSEFGAMALHIDWYMSPSGWSYNINDYDKGSTDVVTTSLRCLHQP